MLEKLVSRLNFKAWLEDGERLLKLETALPHLALVAERAVMRESVSQPFELVVDALSTSANFELKTLVGEQMTLSLKQADGSYRPWHGFVAEAAQVSSDGGLARYRLVMRPWVSALALRLDSHVFQDKTVLQIVEEVFADYPAANWRVNLADASALKPHSLCTQYRESDLAFVQRLLAEEGLSWHVEHLGDTAAGQAMQAGKAKHVLVISDAVAPRDDLGPIRFGQKHPTAVLRGLEDPITDFAMQRQLSANAVTLGSWNYKQLSGVASQQSTALDLGQVPTLEIYDGSGAYRYTDSAAADRAAQMALAAIELGVKRFEGGGGARALRAGAQFSLIDHPLYGANTTALNYVGEFLASHRRADNAFTVLAVEHQMANNLGSEAAQVLASPELAQGSYHNHFHAVPAAAPVVPRLLRKPTAPALLTARVVGVAGETLSTDRDHRIKVQFHFQRGEQPNAGGMAAAYSADAQGNAPGDERSGTWVRVAAPAAGANWGSVYTPRIGVEVAVQFIEGDIDRPLVVGGVHNGEQLPPFSAGVDAGVNHPGVLSGLNSQWLDGSGGHQWVVDDATGQLRTRLTTSYAQAELHLGHLIQQGLNASQRGAWRGSGVEASTQGWASLRAAQGLLVSTQMRAGTYGSAESTQMDAAEAVSQLKAGQELAQRLGEAAEAIQAQGLAANDPGHSVQALIKALDVTQDGKHPDTVNGQQAQRPGDGRAAPGQPVAGFAKPAIVLDTPTAHAQATAASILQQAGQDISLSTQGDWQASAAHTYSQVSGATSSVYAHEGGLQIKAANGPVSLRAHTDELKILADKSVTVVSVNDEIHISANSKIELVAGSSGITLSGGDITFATPGGFSVKGAGHAFLGGGSQAASLPALPKSEPASVAPALNEVAALEVVSALDDGSANDGSRKATRKAMRYDHTYEFKVKEYASQAPVSPGSVQWEAIAHLVDGSTKSVAMKAQGDHAKLTVDDIELCGTAIEVRAFIQAKGAGASISVPVHNRFRWFDGKAVAAQAAQRAAEPWRVNQGQSSLCGMAALFYVMAQAHPAAYQRLAMELHRKGESCIGDYVVKPHFMAAETMYELKPDDGAFKELLIYEVDWITLAVTRSSESMLAFDGLGTGGTDQLKSVNWPGMMAELLQKVAGFPDAKEVDTGSFSMLMKKSLLGKIYDKSSDSDLNALLEIDAQFRSGKKMLLMIDSGMILDEASYSVSRVFEKSHWIVYEGGLVFSDTNGDSIKDPAKASRLKFRAYTWGVNPRTGMTIDVTDDTATKNISVAKFLTTGISVECWKSNIYGYIQAI